MDKRHLNKIAIEENNNNMQNNSIQKLRVWDIDKCFKVLLNNKLLYIITIGLSLILSSLIIISVPRFYSCSVKLAPEVSTGLNSNFSSLASAVGINMSNISPQDAIIPEFYPDVVSSVDFLTSMFPIIVKSKDGKLKTSYYDYLKNHQKVAWWSVMTNKIISQKQKSDPTAKNPSKVNPFQLTKSQSDIANIISRKITCGVDKKTDVITITVEDQDPYICAVIADSACNKLQEFITNYRTKKAKNDLDRVLKLQKQAHDKYVRARQTYASYSDANEDVVLESYKSKVEDLENEMQLKYNNYEALSQQVMVARAKLQERTPAFTILQSATVPIKPAGPKRMKFVLFITMLVFCITSVYVYFKNEEN